MGPARAILGDVNPMVIDVYRAITRDFHAVADVLDTIPMTGDAFYTLRAIDPATLDLTYRAARLIFLMKACFNGVYRTNRSGKFNVPMGSRVYALPTREELSRAAAMLGGATLIAGDFQTTIAESTAGDWVYMDPPYRQAGRYRGEYGYGAKFDDEAFEQFVVVAEKLAARGVQVMVSYQYDERLIDALKGWCVHSVTAARTVASKTASRVHAREMIMTSYPSK